ncbi:DNA mismatch repair endonuclease MutL [Dellaglioa sp. P0083]|uniref:DNA mismatch repair endonuclease MutL n=1 Tax=Dellaglioa kimchii TaxID=3344667 RepID=UPI0038D3AF8B
MTKIIELPTILADQIAAGEVVERPASVVKELVENAIDANGTQVDVVVEEAGLKLIQVIDNGDGIEASQLKNAFKRHATSKITSREDLFKISTLGFRGEALPSIASVAKVTLNTAIEGQPGAVIAVNGGEVVDEKSSASRKGTEITVSDLFYNTPARLKYVKSLQTEMSIISDMMNRLAMSHTNISFSLTHDGKEVLRTTGNGQLKQTISAIYGVKSARQMLEFNGHDLDFKISGYTSLPELTRAGRQFISILINGRYVKNINLNKAIIKGYGSKLMVGRYPITILNIQLDPMLVDVNVHPTKQEVRLSKEPELTELIKKIIYERIAEENLIPEALENLSSKKREKIDTDQLQFDLNEASSKYQAKPKFSSIQTNAVTSGKAKITIGENLNHLSKNIEPISIQVAEQLDSKRVSAFERQYTNEINVTPFSVVKPDETGDVQKENDEETAVTKKSEQRFPDLKYIGQMHGTYLFTESEDGLYILDQHAAQERINYEFYRKQIGDVSSDLQNLLVPIVLEYTVSEAMIITEHTDILEKIGLILEPFGQNSFIIRQHPTWFKEGQEESTIREMIDYLLADGKIVIAEFREKAAIMMSCKRAIKANHHLDDRQAKALIRELKNVGNPFNCPHGRPVLVHFSNQDMEHFFKRIQDSHQTGHEG